MNFKLKPPKWYRNIYKEEVYFFDGDKIAVSVQMIDPKTGNKYWDVRELIVDCDGDRFRFIDPYSEDAEEADISWFTDVKYFMPINSYGPMTKKQMEERS